MVENCGDSTWGTKLTLGRLQHVQLEGCQIVWRMRKGDRKFSLC